jgi:hypothetical protein
MRLNRRRCINRPATAHTVLVRFLYFLADTFINTFGITQPTEKARRQAAFFILGLMVLVVGVAVGAFAVLHAWMR